MILVKVLTRLRKKANTQNLVLLLILILASSLRFIGTIPGYPPFHTDEGITYSQGLAMILEHTLDPKHGYGYAYNYPIIVPLINAIFYLIFFIPLSFIAFIIIFFSHPNHNLELLWTFDQFIFGVRNSNVIFWGRIVTAFFGVLVVLMTYLLGRKVFKSYFVGILAAFFTAINYRQVLNSHIGLPDIYNAFFLLLTLFQIRKLWEKQTTKRYLLAGISVVLYFSTKFQLFAILPLMLALIFIKTEHKIPLKRYLFNKTLVLLVGEMLFAVLVLNTVNLIHLKETLDLVGYTALKYRYGQSTLYLYPLFYLFQIGIGPMASALILAGIVVAIFKCFRQSLFLLSAIIPFFWFMVYFTGAGFYTRNFVTITPVLLIFAALEIVVLFDIFKRYNRPIAYLVITTILILTSWESLKNSLLVPMEYSKKWNYQITQEWINKNIPQNSIIATYPSELFKLNKYKVVEVKSPQEFFLANLQDKGVQFAIIDLDWINGSSYWWMMQDVSTALKFWDRPTTILLNSPIAKMSQELKNYIVFESLNPWQAPDYNILVIKIPSRYQFTGGKLIFSDNFTKLQGWEAKNDGFGTLANFFWTDQVGNKQPGSLQIGEVGTTFYSQRFVSKLIPITEGKLYKIKAAMRTSKIIDTYNSCFLGADIFSENSYLTSALSDHLQEVDKWINRDIIFKSPKGSKYLQIFLQTSSYDISFCWLDDMEVWESDTEETQTQNLMKSNYSPAEHLFPFSNGGL